MLTLFPAAANLRSCGVARLDADGETWCPVIDRPRRHQAGMDPNDAATPSRLPRTGRDAGAGARNLRRAPGASRRPCLPAAPATVDRSSAGARAAAPRPGQGGTIRPSAGHRVDRDRLEVAGLPDGR